MIDIPKDKLNEYYWEKGLSQIKIAKIFNCDPMTVGNRIRQYNISKKTNSEARMHYKKDDFDGNLASKAYLIGFRLGDLNVYQTSKKSSLVVARCNTTHKVQVELIANLFSLYGKVTVSPGTYSTNVNCYLNKSFKFLLPKYITLPAWLSRSKRASASFIAGYVDAEGNFLLNQSRARFKIDSYDEEILLWIFYWLTSKKINAKFRQIAKRGQSRTNGMRFNKDLWRLNVNSASSLLRFIEFIEPFCKHKTRVHDMLLCKNNILERLAKGTITNSEIL
ncbi:MAG: hypothetical protein HY376_03810 [Candidatus Blackburnbacteria bacterium]|nr:hypothetical protein [Candidatus Blackburnbacteria bacterium]